MIYIKVVILVILIAVLIVICKKQQYVYEQYKNNSNKLDESNLPIIIYINLKKDKDRHKTMVKLFNDLKYPKNKIIRCNGIKRSPGLEGCRLSHIKANKIGIKNIGNAPYFIICEDDLKLVGDFYKTIRNAYEMKNVDMFLFECGDKLEKRIKLEYTNNNNFMRILGGGNNSGCYMITPKYARKNIKIWKQKKHIHIDHTWQALWKTHNVYLTRPVVFVQRGLKSNIEKDTIRTETTPFNFKLWESHNNKRF